ncbi:HK97 gp10 family phage protein [Microbaculum marinum]|uniref:HK97 gp10 family phage protein n=1 Tax=Microbaculum marinum TaxID=1764581 RepID=A0AAW9RCB0_9HYPH
MAGSFSLDVSRWVDGTEARMDLVVRKICLDLFTRVILRSPVDTGRFRGNWQISIGDVPDGVLDLTDPSGSATISRTTAEAIGVRAGEEVFFVNNLPYGPALERGHSRQAPAGMVGVTLVEFQQVVEKAANEAQRERR